MRKFTLFVLSACLYAGSVAAQTDARFTHHYFNQLYFNPATSGTDGVARFQLLGRQQWLGYSEDDGTAPATGVLSASVPLLKYNMGVGGVLQYDKYAATNALNFQVSPSYHLALGSGKLSFGLGLGFSSNGKDGSKYRANDQTDAAIPQSINSMKFDVGFGAFYKTQKYYVGISAQHLTEPAFDFGVSKDNTLKRHYYLHGGYNFEVNPNLTLTPNAIVKSTFGEKGTTQAEAGLLATFSNKYWVGLNYADSEAASLLLGVNLLKDNSLRLGYAADLVVSGKEAKSASSHELMLAYSIPVTLKGPKPAIRTPRYRK